jgi:hypothetical protein
MKTLRLRFCPDMGPGAHGIRMRRGPGKETRGISLNFKPVTAVQ